METLGTARREQYSALFLLAAASGLRSSELFALRVNDLDFAASTVRVEESSDQRSAGKIGPCKNVTAYRTVLLSDLEGRVAMRRLKRFLGTAANAELPWAHMSGNRVRDLKSFSVGNFIGASEEGYSSNLDSALRARGVVILLRRRRFRPSHC